MADEIKIGPADPSGRTFQVGFYYPIPPAKRITFEDGEIPPVEQPVVLTPSSELNEWSATMLTSAEKAALDAGEAVYLVHSVGLNSSDKPAAAAKLQGLYSDKAQKALARYENKFGFIGTRVDAP